MSASTTSACPVHTELTGPAGYSDLIEAAKVYDVVVVGSGAAGLMTALRAADHGLSTLIVEKMSKFGGTSATSGGAMWIPNHGLAGVKDSREGALAYLDSIVDPSVRRDKLETYIDTGHEVVRYLEKIGVPLYVAAAYPDYYARAKGASAGRTILSTEVDGAALGSDLHTLREQFPRFKVFNRFAMDIDQAFSLATRNKGWQVVLLKMVVRYWTDLAQRRQTPRDRRLTQGGALIGGLYRALKQRGIEVRLDTGLTALTREDRRVSGVVVEHFGRRYKIGARQGVVIAAGGFEWSQPMRDKYFEFPGSTRWSSTPEEGNKGEGTLAGQAIGAATEYMENGWWAPTMHMPIPGVSNMVMTHQAVFDVGRPNACAVNRNGDRFVDESCGYDEFGLAMIEDHRRTGANLPCWAIFDAQHRAKFSCGGFLPASIMPDKRIPIDWWDHYIFKADSIGKLAEKINIDPPRLVKTVDQLNGAAETGVDSDFGRGDNPYDQFFGDPAVKPNPCLGGIAKAPFYAVPILLGDLGTKGGLKTDCQSRVLNSDNEPILGLYAAGNAAGTPFGNCYPGAGATIGPALVFGFLAAEHLAKRAASQNVAREG